MKRIEAIRGGVIGCDLPDEHSRSTGTKYENRRCIRKPSGPEMQGHRLFQRRVGPARFERRPTIGNRREFMVGRRGEAPRVPPYKFRRPNKAIALPEMCMSLLLRRR